jgi:hypothetical protein
LPEGQTGTTAAFTDGRAVASQTSGRLCGSRLLAMASLAPALARGNPKKQSQTMGGFGCPFLFQERSMNSISNVWKHPRTSAAGLLIAVATVGGVLSQQGISFGHAGSGTVVVLASSLATAVLGLLARDPGGAASEPAGGSASQQARLGVWALIALLLPLPFLGGCSGASVARDIVGWTPALQSAVATVDSTAALLAPADAPIFDAATAGFDAASNLLVGQAKAYLANPSAAVLAEIQTQVVTFQQQVNAALLAAGKIVDPASQTHALAALQAVAAIAGTILALVQSISTKAAVAQMARQSAIKLADVGSLLDRAQVASVVASHYGEPLSLARMQMARAERGEMLAGF